MQPGKISVFFPLLQEGFQVAATAGCDVRSLLCDQLRMDPDYLKYRINTIFLDGHPVDDVATARVRDGATLALSAAMPGLVGATFRKAGALAGFRGSITYRQTGDSEQDRQEGRITLKLFNLVINEIGPSFLARGIRVTGRMLHDLLKRREGEGDHLFYLIEWNGEKIDVDVLCEHNRMVPDAALFLKANEVCT